MEIPVTVEKSITDIMNTKSMSEKGIKTIVSHRFMLNGYKAARFMGSNGTQEVHMVVFGDTTFSVFLNAFYDGSEQKNKEMVWNMVNSAIYEKKATVDPLAKANFTLDLKGSGYKFYTSMMGTLFMFSAEDESDKTLGAIMVTQVPNEGITSIDDFADKMIAQLAQKGIKSEKEPTEKRFKIDGYDALEKVVIANSPQSDGKKSSVYIVTIKADDKSFAFMGMGVDDKEETLNRFRKIADTFKVKK
jgi:hypothetical protein